MSNEVVVESLRLAIRRASHEDTPEHQPSLNDEGLRRPLIPSPHSTIHVFPDSSVMDIGTIPETIIQFADIPSLSLMSFGSTRSLSNFCGDSDQQLPESCRQWTKDSHKTLVNDSMMMTSRREDVIGRLGEDKQVFVWDPTIDARRVHIPMPNDPQLPTKDTSKAASRGDNGEPRKQPIALPQRNGTPPAKTTSGPQRPTKRYVDPRLDKRARKVAFKTATTLFSNERTFIHWIKFGMLLGTLAMTLLNFSGVEAHLGANQELAGNASKIGQHVGVSLMAICLLCLVYASSTYHWRHIGVVRGKNDDRHFDRIGPTLLALGLLVTYAINITLTLQATSGMVHDYQHSAINNTPQVSSSPAISPVAIPPPVNTSCMAPGSGIIVDKADSDEDGEILKGSKSPLRAGCNDQEHLGERPPEREPHDNH